MGVNASLAHQHRKPATLGQCELLCRTRANRRPCGRRGGALLDRQPGLLPGLAAPRERAGNELGQDDLRTKVSLNET